MKFTFETVYNRESLTAMARALRKTLRHKRNIAVRIFGILVIVLSVLLLVPTGGETFKADFSTIITILAIMVIVFVLFFEDRINGTAASRRIMQGALGAVCTFTDDGYTSSLDIGKTEWHYENIMQSAETANYFVFLFDRSHAQVYDKRTLEGGTADEFRSFISEKTGKTVKKV